MSLEREKRGDKSQPPRGVLAIEKRKHPRYSIEFPLDYSVLNAKTTYNAGVAADASEGGLLVYLPERIEVGVLLRIEIFYAKGLAFETIMATTRVVWSDLASKVRWGEHWYGLQFHSIDDENLSKLKALLKEAARTQL